ncbi:MAG: hypothetical protein D6722_28715 [Bacteroidetes bacterium]|nr:MAG: hypothetical protein D6722_28715 [Bacteroidota bacterium]
MADSQNPIDATPAMPESTIFHLSPKAVYSPDLVPVSFPTVNIRLNGGYFDIEMAVPGFTRDEVDVVVEHDRVVVSGRKEPDAATRPEIYRRLGHIVDSFERSFELDGLADEDGIMMRMVQGILYLRIPQP